jgi:RNA polymerase sigma-70 factor (ECF subfamily)
MTPSVDSDRDRRFTELLERHHRRLYGYIFTLLRNHQDAQDIFQQTSLVLWEKFDEFRPETSFPTWACTVARFKAFDHRKQQRRRRTHFSELFERRLAEVHANIASDEFEARSEALDDCVQKLPPGQRALLQDCFGEGRSVAILAKELGRTTHSVYSSLCNIRKKLLDCVAATVPKERKP